MTTATASAAAQLSSEHRDLLDTLADHRRFLRRTVEGLTEEQIRARSTVSGLTLGAIVKHVAAQEAGWIRFVLKGPASMAFTPEAMADHAAQFQLEDGETLEGLLAAYDEVAARTVEVVAAEADLSRSHPLPEAPWFEPGAVWSVRRVLAHIIAETAQHSGHADIIREAIDGQKTMG